MRSSIVFSTVSAPVVSGSAGFPETTIPEARARDRGKGGATRRDSVRTSEAAGRAHPLRRARGRGRWSFSFLISDSRSAQPPVFVADAEDQPIRSGIAAVAGAAAIGSDRAVFPENKPQLPPPALD